MFLLEPFEFALEEQLSCFFFRVRASAFWVVEENLVVYSFPIFAMIIPIFVGCMAADVRSEDHGFENRDPRMDATNLLIQRERLNHMALDILSVALLGSSNDLDLIK